MAKKRRNRKRRSNKTAICALVAAVVIAIGWVVGLNMTKSEKALDGLAVHYVDVGQGDAILLQAPTGENMLIDAGPGASEENLLSYLTEADVKTLDYFVLTHPDEDHIGGADRVFEECTVSNVILPDCRRDTKVYQKLMDSIENEEGCEQIEPISGDVYLVAQGMTVTVLSPLMEEYDDVNDYSIVLRVDYYETSFLFTGDAGTEVEKQMLDHWEEEKLDCDVLKVGHHGSRTSSSKAFLEAVTPEYAVISSGEGNKYGHPHAEIVARLEKDCPYVYRTDELGSVVLTSDGETISFVSGT